MKLQKNLYGDHFSQKYLPGLPLWGRSGENFVMDRALQKKIQPTDRQPKIAQGSKGLLLALSSHNN
jgi:hypothetical protein